ncbi:MULTISPECIES: hypothetical protein [Bacillus]|uniref:Uncharacterized protein n=1 Tax=Bacillus capparidis TaxID=1840411 RepID=A0ABS4CW85_9BACI|nr:MULTISPECIES: hypothetical protein [Bacillus]MBP1081849.1 hypothetical protein [Bacillus capparidis]MED1096498.1 hypothetical protein [Bacillus capparidis]
MKEKEPSYKEMAIGEKLIVIGGIGIIIIVSLAILSGVTFFWHHRSFSYFWCHL